MARLSFQIPLLFFLFKELVQATLGITERFDRCLVASVEVCFVQLSKPFELVVLIAKLRPCHLMIPPV